MKGASALWFSLHCVSQVWQYSTSSSTYKLSAKWSYLRGTVQWQAGCPPVAWRCRHCAWIAPHGICRRSPSPRFPRWWCRPFPRWRSRRSFPVPVGHRGIEKDFRRRSQTTAFHWCFSGQSRSWEASYNSCQKVRYRQHNLSRKLCSTVWSLFYTKTFNFSFLIKVMLFSTLNIMGRKMKQSKIGRRPDWGCCPGRLRGQ